MGFIIYYLFILSKRWQKEPGLSQKTFLRSRQEMPRYLKRSKTQESRQRPTELLLERLLMPTPRNTTKSIPPLKPHSSSPTETLRLLDPSTLKTHQKLPLLLELEVSESLHQSQRRSCNSSDLDNSTTLFSSSLTKPHGTCSR